MQKEVNRRNGCSVQYLTARGPNTIFSTSNQGQNSFIKHSLPPPGPRPFARLCGARRSLQRPAGWWGPGCRPERRGPAGRPPGPNPRPQGLPPGYPAPTAPPGLPKSPRQEAQGERTVPARPRARQQRLKLPVPASPGHRTGPGPPPPSSGKVRVRQPERERTISHTSSRRHSGSHLQSPFPA